MRVIASSTLHGFVRNCVNARERRNVELQLSAWLSKVESANWQNSAELKEEFRSASIISAERVVFNIKGNHYRLVASINYRHRILLVNWLGTHEEYDSIDVNTISYSKEGYANPSH